MLKSIKNIFSNCRRILGNRTWGRILEALGDDLDSENFPEKLESLKSRLGLPEYVPDLARVEQAYNKIASGPAVSDHAINTICVNPMLKLLPVGWKHLTDLMRTEPGKPPAVDPSKGTHILIWKHPETGRMHIQEADDADLLALKIIIEKTDYKTAAAQGGVTIGVIDHTIQRSISRGILVSPPSRIRRNLSP